MKFHPCLLACTLSLFMLKPAVALETHQQLNQAILSQQTEQIEDWLRQTPEPFIESEYKLPDQDYYLLNPLMLTAAVGSVKMLLPLINAGFDPNQSNGKGLTALMLAARFNTDPEMLKVLLAAGANGDVLDQDENTVFHAAARNPNPAVLQFLHAHLKESLLLKHNLKQETALHIAAEAGQSETVKFLLNTPLKKAVNSPATDGRTPLHKALLPDFYQALVVENRRSQQTLIVNLLLTAGAIPSLKLRDLDGRVPLEWAVENASLEALQQLISAAPAQAQDSFDKLSQNLLLSAVSNSQPDVLAFLLASGLAKKIPPEFYTDHQHPLRKELLFKAVENAQPHALQALFDAGLVPDIQITSEGDSPLHVAAFLDQPATIELLLNKGADPWLKDNQQNLPLHKAAWGRQRLGPRSLQLLLAATGPAALDAKNSQGETPFHLACTYADAQHVQFLWDAGSRKHIHTPDHFGRLPIHLALSGVDTLSKLKILLSGGAAKDLQKTDKAGNLPLHLAAGSADDNLEVLQALLPLVPKSQFQQKTKEGLTILQSALLYHEDNPKVVQWLLAQGAPPDFEIPLMEPERWTLVHFLSYFNRPQNLKLVLELGANRLLETQDAQGYTALHHAVGKGHLEVVKLLLAAGADIYAQNHEGATPWDFAQPYGDEAPSEIYTWMKQQQQK